MNSSTRSAGARARGSGARTVPPDGTRASATILVVADDAALRGTLAAVLSAHGYTVRTAGDPAETRRVVARLEPALVLLDMRMPAVDGPAFASALRQPGRTPPPMIVMGSPDRVGQWCREVGGAEALGTPFDVPRLLGAIDRLRRRPPQLRP